VQGPEFYTRIPRTGDGRGLAYAVLIRRICPRRTAGDVFDGRRLRPGARLPESELRPTPEHPEAPLVLEYAGSDRSGRGHRRSQHLYVLWQYSRELREWRELARASGEALEWVDVLKPVALRSVGAGQAAGQGSPGRGAARVSHVLTVLEDELEDLAGVERRDLLGLLYEQVSARLAQDVWPRDGIAR
jgi:hypothetical protein